MMNHYKYFVFNTPTGEGLIITCPGGGGGISCPLLYWFPGELQTRNLGAGQACIRNLSGNKIRNLGTASSKSNDVIKKCVGGGSESATLRCAC